MVSVDFKASASALASRLEYGKYRIHVVPTGLGSDVILANIMGFIAFQRLRNFGHSTSFLLR